LEATCEVCREIDGIETRRSKAGANPRRPDEVRVAARGRRGRPRRSTVRPRKGGGRIRGPAVWVRCAHV
jgi:hypothetical protein